jgi:hypothetical protein
MVTTFMVPSSRWDMHLIRRWVLRLRGLIGQHLCATVDVPTESFVVPPTAMKVAGRGRCSGRRSRSKWEKVRA